MVHDVNEFLSLIVTGVGSGSIRARGNFNSGQNPMCFSIFVRAGFDSFGHEENELKNMVPGEGCRGQLGPDTILIRASIPFVSPFETRSDENGGVHRILARIKITSGRIETRSDETPNP